MKRFVRVAVPLAALSAVWVVAALLNMESAPTSAPSLVQQNPAAPRQLLVALRENRRQLMELLDAPIQAPTVPGSLTPRRSEVRTLNVMA